MARYAAAGDHVALVTCTRGEQGEVIPPSLAHLAPAPGQLGEALGQHREGELAAATAALGVADHRFLGDPDRRWVDSGMEYAPDGGVVPAPWSPPAAFALAPVDEPAAVLADVVRELRPDVVVTYGPDGGYGHPDHVQTHRVTMRAVELAAPGHDVPKVYWIVRPDQAPTTRVDASPFTAAKVAAMRAHATQLAVDEAGETFALSNGEVSPIEGVEHYRLVRGTPVPAAGAGGLEDDLFAGLG